MAGSIALLKKEIRQTIQTRLAKMTPAEYLLFNSAIQKKFMEFQMVQNSKSIMLYYSIKNEVETVSIITALLEMGKDVILPACTPEKDLRAARIDNPDELVPGIFGLKEPASHSPEINPTDLDLIVVPGVAFDEHGYRLGYGAGYYDRFLARTSDIFKLGLAYDFQLIKELPKESHDLPVNGVLTPLEYREFIKI